MRQRSIITLIALFFSTFCLSCIDLQSKNKRKKIGAFFVEARFKNDSTIDGPAKFFDKNDVLKSTVNYVNGLKHGPAINYFGNGKLKDSMNFIYGVKNGFQFAYDSAGKLISINYDYYGLRVGPEMELNNEKIRKYYFVDFNKEDLIECKYNSYGQVDEIPYFTTRPRVSKVRQGESFGMLELFFYLPKPPGVDVKYQVGLTNKNKNDRNLFFVANDRIIFDTLLPYPANGWHYYVSAHVKTINNQVNRIFLEEIREDDDSSNVVR
jgi:hypothetical protein